MSKVRLALIGFGKWGRNYVRAAEDSGEAEVAVVINRGDGLTEAMHRCDAYVYAGHPSDAAWACDVALDLGRPILCEKPAGLSLAAAERIAAAEARSKAFVLAGHQHLFAEGYEAFREYAKGRAVISRSFGPVARDYSTTWDYGPHAVSMALGVVGAPRKIEHTPMLCVNDQANALFGYNPERETRIVSFDDDLEGDLSYNAYASSAEPPLTRQVRAFARAVKAGGTDDYRFGAKWAVDVARVLEAAEGPIRP